eukprot:10555120-Alexandrium_andersonii.AAC.1
MLGPPASQDPPTSHPQPATPDPPVSPRGGPTRGPGRQVRAQHPPNHQAQPGRPPRAAPQGG